MLAYLLRYIGNFSSRYELLRKPTRDDAKFAWTNEQQTVFEDLKQAIMSVPVLISNYTRHETLEICDGSPTGLGGALFQKTQHGYQQSSKVEKRFFRFIHTSGRFPLRKIRIGSDFFPSCIIRTGGPKKLKILHLFICGSQFQNGTENWYRKPMRGFNFFPMCSDVFRSRAYFPEWKPALIVQDHPVW